MRFLWSGHYQCGMWELISTEDETGRWILNAPDDSDLYFHTKKEAVRFIAKSRASILPFDSDVCDCGGCEDLTVAEAPKPVAQKDMHGRRAIRLT